MSQCPHGNPPRGDTNRELLAAARYISASTKVSPVAPSDARVPLRLATSSPWLVACTHPSQEKPTKVQLGICLELNEITSDTTRYLYKIINNAPPFFPTGKVTAHLVVLYLQIP